MKCLPPWQEGLEDEIEEEKHGEVVRRDPPGELGTHRLKPKQGTHISDETSGIECKGTHLVEEKEVDQEHDRHAAALREHLLRNQCNPSARMRDRFQRCTKPHLVRHSVSRVELKDVDVVDAEVVEHVEIDAPQPPQQQETAKTLHARQGQVGE